MTAPVTTPTPVPLHESPLVLGGLSRASKTSPDPVRQLHDLLPAGSEMRHLLDDDDRYRALAPTGVAA